VDAQDVGLLDIEGGHVEHTVGKPLGVTAFCLGPHGLGLGWAALRLRVPALRLEVDEFGRREWGEPHRREVEAACFQIEVQEALLRDGPGHTLNSSDQVDGVQGR
jgi:hypothetical protein